MSWNHTLPGALAGLRVAWSPSTKATSAANMPSVSRLTLSPWRSGPLPLEAGGVQDARNVIFGQASRMNIGNDDATASRVAVEHVGAG